MTRRLPRLPIVLAVGAISAAATLAVFGVVLPLLIVRQAARRPENYHDDN